MVVKVPNTIYHSQMRVHALSVVRILIVEDEGYRVQHAYASFAATSVERLGIFARSGTRY
jgi:hypothetical protein